ncbi:MAG: cobalt-precorrin-5B (C(1))-methyltransferase CbiD [Pyrobaculum sp.]
MIPLKRFGITTGLAAAAAAKAAALKLRGESPTAVVVPTPIGLRIEVSVESTYIDGDVACGEVRKFSGDNPDVLDGALVRACVKPARSFEIKCGRGVGVVTKPGLPVPPGECAINPVPRMMIEAAVREAGLDGAVVVVEVPDGERLAALTMNYKVGVVGGVSILGTTGIEYPVSDEDYIQHIEAELNVLQKKSSLVVLAQGNQSAKAAAMLFGDVVVKIGDLVGDAVRSAAALGFKKIYVATMPGKLAKIASGAMNTHSKYCDCRVESVAYSALAVGVPVEIIKKLGDSVGEAIEALGKWRTAVVLNMAQRAKAKILERTGAAVGIYVFDKTGEVLAAVEP